MNPILCRHQHRVMTNCVPCTMTSSPSSQQLVGQTAIKRLESCIKVEQSRSHHEAKYFNSTVFEN